jgi:hypothetical protein
MIKQLAWTAGILFILGSFQTPHAQAAPLCEPRSLQHALERGETVDSDSRWHVLRGELPTCGANEPLRAETSRDGSAGDGKSRFCRKSLIC